MNKLSVCVFIKNNNDGAFCLWESMATLMPLADEFLVMDLGSTDGTLEILKQLASKNKKIRLEESVFPINPITDLVDAGSFAVIPNLMIPTLKNDLVMYYQADEIWHENLIKIMLKRLENLKDFKGLSFWRYQLADNFQKIKWFPLIVHRIGYKGDMIFDPKEDGMNPIGYNDAEMCSNYNAGWFTRWGAEYSRGRKERVDEHGNTFIYGTRFKEKKTGKEAHELPTHEMILDISSMGGFLNNIRDKSKFHAPMWRTDPRKINVDGIFYDADEWYSRQLSNPDWTKPESPFDIPEIIRPLVGKKTYPVREDIINQIANS